jgi:hypothetical protein
MAPDAQAANDTALSPGDPIAAVVAGNLPPASLDDAALESAIRQLHRTNPPRNQITDACVAEYHRRRHPPES